MIPKLAIRNLFHDKVRFSITLIGILFAVVLVSVQLGLYQGARLMIVATIDHTQAKLWIMAHGASSFEQAALLTQRERYKALATPGVQSVEPLVVQFAEWRAPDNTTTNVVVIGTNSKGLLPWNITEGDVSGLKTPNAVIADKTYLDSLGVKGVGSTAQIEGARVKVVGLTEGIRSFTTSPYIFMRLSRANALLGVGKHQATFQLVNLVPGADAESVRQDLSSRLPNITVLTDEEFRERNLDYWLFGTGAGVALLGGAILGLVVGTVIVAQTLYSSTKDNLNEFATLRALGSSSRYIHKVILLQAGISAVCGYVLGMAISLVVVAFSGETALPILITGPLAALLLGLTLGMCILSALSSIFKVTRIDPAMVFGR